MQFYIGENTINLLLREKPFICCYVSFPFPKRENSIRSKILLLGSERDDVCPLLGIHLGREQVALLSAALILPGL